MTESEWLTSSDPTAMLRVATGRHCNRCGCRWADNDDFTMSMLPGEKCCMYCDNEPFLGGSTRLVSTRKISLFALAVFRAIQPHLPNQESMARIWESTLEDATNDLLMHLSHWLGDHPKLRSSQAALLRDIAGNPFRPVKPLRHTVRAAADMSAAALESGASEEEVWVPPWLAWNNSTVPKLAEAIYQDRAWDRMPILADALEDAGCTDQAILDHCRSTEPHARGCHVVDLILDKE